MRACRWLPARGRRFRLGRGSIARPEAPQTLAFAGAHQERRALIARPLVGPQSASPYVNTHARTFARSSFGGGRIHKTVTAPRRSGFPPKAPALRRTSGSACLAERGLG